MSRGETNSLQTSFPEKVGPDLAQNGGVDAFVVKVDPSGGTLVYAGFIGGSADDRGKGIAVDAVGNAYVTGETSSGAISFPVIGGPALIHSGGVDAFVAKVNAAGTSLVYSGFIGGFGTDRGNGIAVDAVGAAYVAGETDSTQSTFPDAVGPDLTQNGGFDAFVAKVNPAGTALVYAGFIGGSGDDRGKGIAVDVAGNAYLTGTTTSTASSFPDGNGFGAVPGPDQTFNGGVDAFVAKVNAAGTALVYAGYIGGAGDDRANGIAVDTAGSAYVTGETTSTALTFPVVIGPDLVHSGGIDAFVAKVNAAGTALDYAGYIGGIGDDRGNAIAVDAAGNAYVAGDTTSTQTTFPANVGPDVTHNGGVDAFVARVSSDGTGLDHAGYIGGGGDDRAKGIAVDVNGNIYVTGETNSGEASFPARIGPSLTHSLGFDAFVAKICGSACVDLSVSQGDSPDPVRAGDDLSYTITVTNNGPDTATGVELTDLLPTSVNLVSATSSSGSCAGTTTITCNLGSLASGHTATVTVVVTTTAVRTLINFVHVTADQTDIDPANDDDTENTAATLPNLALKRFVAPGAVIPGRAITVEDTTANSGAIAAPASVTRFYLSEDGRLDGAEIVLGSRAIPPLAPKQADAGSSTVTIPPGTALGRYFLFALADADNAVAETNNANKKNRRLTVTRPSLTVSALRAPSSAAAGSTIAIQETTSNGGLVAADASTTRFFLSTDNVFDGADVPLGSRAVPALAPRGKNAASTSVSIPPGTAPAIYFVIAVADADGAVEETIETDNARSKRLTIRP